MMALACLALIMGALMIASNAKVTQPVGEQGRSLFEGDIKLSSAQQFTSRSVAAVSTTWGVAWPNGIVPYEFAPGYTFEQETYVVSVMRKLENMVAVNNVRCVQFRPRVSTDRYFIIIENGEGCSSYVGQNTGLTMNRTVTLQSTGCLFDGTVMHEFLHTLGFYHEQSRPDRDTYVRVNLANVVPGMEHNFVKYDNFTSTDVNTPYDYDSVMHYGRTAFSRNGLPTMEPIRSPNATIGQRNNLSAIDVQAVRRFYNCSATGTTLPPTTTPSTAFLYYTNTTYSSSWTTSSPRFSRYGAPNGTYYYHAIRLTVSTANYYRFKSSSSVDTYCYVYASSFLPASPQVNLRAYDDDTGGNSQFQLTIGMQPNMTYVLVVTAFYANVTGAFDVIASGEARVNMQPWNSTLSPSSTTSATTRASTTEYMATSSYRGQLNGNSSSYTRLSGSGLYYVEAIVVTVPAVGNYIFTSNCSIDAYGFLYLNTVDGNDLTVNLLVTDDDTAGNAQFRLTYNLETSSRYILLFTTYAPNSVTSFIVNAFGPSPASMARATLTLTLPSTSASTMPSTMASSSPATTSRGNAAFTVTYNGALLSTGTTYTRPGIAGTGRYFYEVLEVTVGMMGNYTFVSVSGIDAYGYLYAVNVSASNLLIADDDSGGSNQFRLLYILGANRTYIVVFTTYAPEQTASFSVTGSGPGMINFRRLSLSLSTGNFTAMSTAAASTTAASSVTSIYGSALTNSSATYSRPGFNSRFFYEAVEVIPSTAGDHTFISNSSVDAYGYLYVSRINASDLYQNLIALDDDAGGIGQFRMASFLQAGGIYILIFTTYGNDIVTPFSVSATGPGRVSFRRLNLSLIVLSPTTYPWMNTTMQWTYATPNSTAPTTTTRPATGCNRTNAEPTCPTPMTTNGTAFTLSRNSSHTTDAFFPANSTFFNRNDSSPVNGYLRSVTVEYHRTRLPTATARVWIYTIIPIAGSYLACAQYAIPSSQILTTQTVQTYTIPDNIVYVFNTTSIGVGIQDTSAGLLGTSGGLVLRTDRADLSRDVSARGPVYFMPGNGQNGAKISYKVIM